MGLILDYIRIDADFWREFTTGYKRSFMKVKNYEDPTILKMEAYFLNQVAPCIAILREIKGNGYINYVLNRGLERAKNNTKYAPIFHAYGIKNDDE